MDINVMRAVYKNPRLDEVKPEWHVRAIQGDLNGSSNKDQFTVDLSESEGKLMVWSGRSFNLWNPSGAPYAYADPVSMNAFLTNRIHASVKNRNSPYFLYPLNDVSYPFQKARVAFRQITNQTNTRTSIVCLIPPNSPLVNSGQILIFHKGSSREEAFALGIMSSIPYDWSVRKWVELHFTMEILYPSRVPHHKVSTIQGQRLIEISGRLAAVDSRFEHWAQEVGVTVGSVKSEAEKVDLIHEIDALVAVLYGLTEEQLSHMFRTFHKGWDYRPRLQEVLAHFNNWKDK
jgi:hypothetical protein